MPYSPDRNTDTTHGGKPAAAPDAKKALDRLAALCSRREYCTADLQRKLQTWGLDSRQQAEVIAALVKGRYADDTRYAAAFARDKALYDRWGRKKIALALRLKRISDDDIAAALDQIPPGTDTDNLDHLLRAKLRSTTARSPYELRQKLLRYAVGRGYDFQDAADAIDSLDTDFR